VQQLSKKGGTTATAALVVGNHVYLANVGDSRAILGTRAAKGVKAQRISTDHKLKVPEEKKRVLKEGGKILERQGRVVSENHTLNMTRSLGDFDFKSEGDVVPAEPYMNAVDLTSDDWFLVLASDGLWTVFKDQDVADFVASDLAKGKSPQEIANSLSEEVQKKPGCDNTTIITLVFCHGNSTKSSEST